MTEETRYTDMTGRPICVGDTIAYSTKTGSGYISIYEVVGRTGHKMKVKSWDEWSRRWYTTCINFPSCSLVLNTSIDLEKLIKGEKI